MKYIKIYFSILLIFFYHAATAMVVFDPSVFSRMGQELYEMQKQGETIKRQLDALKQLNGDQYQWSNMQNLLNQLGGLVKKSNSIAYSAENIESDFKKSYPGYHAPDNFQQSYQDNVSKSLDTMNGALQSLGANAHDFQNENARLSFLQHQVQGAKGQTQAIQASAQIASELVSQTQLLRQAVIAQSNAQTAYYATQVQNEAFARSDLEKVIHAGSTKTVAYGSSGNYIKLPNFK